MKAKGIDINGNVKYFDILNGKLFCHNNNLKELVIPNGCKIVSCDHIILHNVHDNVQINIFI